ncbi:methyltransferase family protein [Luteimonas lutimaris]|uniref:Phosphatidylethanolamine N-methyltransferase family protein n=1 Tax=Luteimonas lutimaris TaxID=698645 RepID=A0ABP7M0W0_9GAMM|nr:isoprenylcysteine carboxylmethyltransferase family protein [Luteimonas sp.]
MDKLFPALCLAWFASECWILLRLRSGDAGRRRDGGTLRVLVVVIFASIALATGFDGLDVARFARPLQAPLWWLGIALMVAGMPLRWWSIHVLARHFTVDVAIRPDHELIRSGPYRLLRHPSYTGLLMTFAGFALCLGNWLSLAAMAPVVLALMWRIQVEERALSAAFPDGYPAYARTTKRLLPYVW